MSGTQLQAPASEMSVGQAGKSQKHAPLAFLAQTLRPTPVPSGQSLASSVLASPSHACGPHALVPASTAGFGQAGKSQKHAPLAFLAQTVRPTPVPSGQIFA